MRTHRRPFALAITGLLTTSVLFGCGSGDDSSSSSSEAEQISIGVGVDATYAEFFVADAEGLFDKAGLNVKIVSFSAGGDAVQAIAGKQVQLAGSSPTTLVTVAAQNPNLRAMFVYMESGKYIKVVAREGISGASDIKTFGVVPGLSTFMANAYLTSQGVDPAGVEFVSSDPASLPALTAKGDVDAYALWEPWPSKGADLGLRVLTDTGAFGQPTSQVLAGDQSWVDEHTEDVATVAEVLQDAADKIKSDPETAAKDVAAATGGDEKQAAKDLALVDYGTRAFTDQDYTTIGQQADYFVEAGIVKQAPNLEDVFLRSWYTDNVK
jgi:ABC-type nitrate/sulfonate/bicarbonate transport system substrate-binding protein